MIPDSPDLLFFRRHDRAPSLLGTSEDKVDVFRYRYDVIKQRLLRNDNFKPPAFARETDQAEYHKITSIKNLLGCEDQHFLLFGMLSQLQPGRFYLEDLDADVELVLDHAEIGSGLFTETCFVLAAGIYLGDNRFQVEELAMPPSEEREQSLLASKMVNFFGGPVLEDSVSF